MKKTKGPSWLKLFSRKASDEMVHSFCRVLLKRIGPSRIRDEVDHLVASRNWLSLAAKELEYAQVPTSGDAYCLSQIIAFFQKRPDLVGFTSFDRQEKALVKFLKTEEKCRETNQLFRMRALGEFRFTQ